VDVRHLGLPVRDDERSMRFYATYFGFDPATAQRLHEFIYSAGNLRDPAEAYIAFRGRLPSPDALLRQRGLADAAR